MPEAGKSARRTGHSVLIVTSAAALRDGADAERALKFVRELSGFGWSPILFLAGGPKDALQPSETTLPRAVPVTCVPWRSSERTSGPQSKMTGNAWAWCVRANARARRIVRRESPTAVLTIGSSPMFHIIGRWLAKTTNAIWVADLPEAPYATPQSRSPLLPPYREHIVHVVERAEYWVAASDELRAEWMGLRHSSFTPETRVIRTGFDVATVSDPASSISDWVRRETFRVVCLSTPRSHNAVQRLLQAIAALVRQQAVSESRLHVDIAFASNQGQTRDYRALIDQLQVGSVTSISPFGSDVELRQHIRAASAVILAGETGATTGKLMSYLCECMPVRIPVLAIANDSETRGILNRTQVGSTVPKSNLPAVIAAIAELVRTGGAAPWFDPKWSVIREFSSTYQAQQLANFLLWSAVHRKSSRPVSGSWQAPTLRRE